MGVIANAEGEFVTVPLEEAGEFNLMQDVFYIGTQMNLTTLDEVRERAALPVKETV